MNSSTAAVVLTYPGHFFQTDLTIKSIRLHIGPETKIYLIVDDVSNLAWPGYFSDCQQHYGIKDLIPTSSISDMPRLRKWPYVRQQSVKLYLDRVIPESQWIFLDGDVRLRRAVPPGTLASCVEYQGEDLSSRDPGPGEKSSQILFYIRHMLGIDFRGFWNDHGGFMTASHPPVHWMSAEVLESLRGYVEQHHGQDFLTLHLAMAEDPRYSMCEWDLLECFQQEILGRPRPWNCESGDVIDTTWVCDRELGLDWFQSHGIEPDPRIWPQLPLAKYL
jgi:hypothetical protein